MGSVSCRSMFACLFPCVLSSSVLNSEGGSTAAAVHQDWLIHAPNARARVIKNGNELVVTNGLVSRTIRIAPNAATVDLTELTNAERFVRAASPEAVVKLNGAEYPVGGLTGQKDLGYLRADWIDQLSADPNAFRFTGYETGDPIKKINWKPTRPHEDLPWPPKGIRLTLHFAGPEAVKGVGVNVNYELYDGMPVFCKWIDIVNLAETPVTLDSFDIEKLSMVEPESSVDDSRGWLTPNVTVLTDYQFGGGEPNDLNRTVNWDIDKAYSTQVNYNLTTPCVLRISPPHGPAAEMKSGESLSSFHAYTIVHDSWDRERKGLAVRRAYRALAPWITENPIMLHLTSTDPKVVHEAMDQAAAVGFEMVIFSFGSGLNMEDSSPANIAKYKDFADYAHKRGLQVGGYSLLASRRIDDATDVIDPKTGKPDKAAVFGSSPCLCSEWGAEYFRNIRAFLSGTGFDLLEHDGSYPGDVCASTTHPGHKGLEDSQWNQFQVISAFYRWCRQKGIFLNVPDNYFLSGSNKTGMGYRETNWSLPRAQQHIHCRQNLYDGTWLKPPTMGWTFVPLVEYQGGGPAATIEPLHEHIADYEKHLVNNFGYGAQACYRGPRLYDSPEVKAMVAKWVGWFKAHRKILESDVIHIRRADGEHVDAILHVNPNLAEKGLLMVWNPSSKPFGGSLTVPLYYTGLTDIARVSREDGPASEIKPARDYSIDLPVEVPAEGFTWYVVR